MNFILCNATEVPGYLQITFKPSNKMCPTKYQTPKSSSTFGTHSNSLPNNNMVQICSKICFLYELLGYDKPNEKKI